MGKKQTNPNSLANLRSGYTDMTPEERHAAAVKGGRTRAENMRKRTLFRDIIAEIGSKKLSKRRMGEKMSALAELYGITGDITPDVLVTLSMYNKAIDKGDVDAARYIRDTSGQKPAENVQIGPIDAQNADLSQYSDEQLEALEADCLSASDGNFDGD